MRAWLLWLAACGAGGGGSGTFEATVHMNGAESVFSEACDLAESGTFWDIYASSGEIQFEMKWKQDAITAPGTYTSTGIVDQISIFVANPDIASAAGMVTFETYDPPSKVAGTFTLSVEPSLDASGSFDCR